jgi:RNA polymerase sigma-70 factor (ECF subfamily)
MSDTVSVEFSQQLTQIQRKLYSYILSLVPNRAEAEDILQESNFVLCRKAKEYDKDRIVELLAEELEDNSRFEKMRKALSYCLDELGERSRAVARLRFEKNCTLLEIAEKLGRPMGTVSATLYRVRVALAQCVRKKVAEEEAAELA